MTDTMSYLRVSLLRGCNLRCFYCRPAGADTGMVDAPVERRRFEAAIKVLHLAGVRKVRFTGGEPTLYKDLTRLAAYTRNLDEGVHVAMTTNGVRLSKLAEQLGSAGVNSVNISLDSLRRDRFHRITARDRLNNVLSGIEAAMKHVPVVKLNCVMMRGINDDEAGSMIAFANDLGITIRFIEFMPSRTTGAVKRWYVSGDEIRERVGYSFLPVRVDPTSAARYYRSGDLDISVGFINPVSHPFCAHCNRLRLASDGKLYGCLFSDRAVDLFEALDAGREPALRRIADLVESKRFQGCSGAIRAGEALPSFIGIGG